MGTHRLVLRRMLDLLMGKQINLVAANANVVRKKRICIIDDDDTIRAMLQRILQRSGYDVVSTHDGSDIAELTPKKVGPVDLILCDVNLPERCGPEIVAALKHIHPSAEVIFMSGSPPNQTVRSAVGSGSARFIDKPFTTPSLLRQIDEMLLDVTAKKSPSG